MLKTKLSYQRAAVNFKRSRKGKTVPDQSMSIKEIVRRFVRNIPIDVVQRTPIYLDQDEFDMEQISRMDFADKSALADELSARAKAIKEQLQGEVKAQAETERQAAIDRKAKARKGSTGIGSLDNTMPVDTKQSIR